LKITLCFIEFSKVNVKVQLRVNIFNYAK
jgi:hypothetical protein